MKNLLTILLLTISVSSFGQTISGIIIDGVRKDTISFASVQLLDFSAMSKGGQMTDEKGKFKFENVSIGSYSIKVKSIGYKDTTFQKVEIIGDTVLTLDIHKYCKYDASINDKTCPVCHKQDKVIQIVYGLLVSTNGKDPLKEDGKTFKSGGCNISYCDPHWYCKRDKTEF